MTKPAGQTALGRLPVREEPQHTNTCDQTCRPDRTRRVSCQGGAATHPHMRPNLPARPHSAGRRSGMSRNTPTHATKPAGQTALGRSPVREEPQHTNTCDEPCRRDYTQSVYAVQAHLSECNLYPKFHTFFPNRMVRKKIQNGCTNQGVVGKTNVLSTMTGATYCETLHQGIPFSILIGKA